MDRRILGSFLEHLGRAVYEGVYDPKSPLADANGFRNDVMAEVKGLGVPIIRYPGGNFVSGYNWLDGVGPKSQRPTVLDRAWNTLEPNQFGTNEFIQWAKLVDAEPLLGGNFGTGTVAEQVALVEYCNVYRGTRWSELRRSHGFAQSHNVRALPVTIGTLRHSRHQNPRHPDHSPHGSSPARGTTVGGWPARQIHEAVLTTFRLSAKTYRSNQLRYGLRKLKGHRLLQRAGSRYAYHLAARGIQVALLFLFFHRRLCGPLANGRFHQKPDPNHRPKSKLEVAYHKADKAIQDTVELLAAA